VHEYGTRDESLKIEKVTSRFRSPSTAAAHGHAHADAAVGVGASVAAAAGGAVDVDVHTSAGGNGTVYADDVHHDVHDVGVPSPSPCLPPSPALAQIPTNSGLRYVPQVAALALTNEEAKGTEDVQKQLAQKTRPHPKDYAHQSLPQMAFAISASTS
jgi:hypothetical protein